jgi:aspartate racemase
MTERILGIVGGVGPESTADYYRRLIARWSERGPTGSYPHVLVDSLNSRSALTSIIDGDIDPSVRLFRASVERLAGAGAGLALVASVMMHIAYERVAAVAPIPMLSILDELVSAARAAGITRPAVLGARPTVEGEFFARPFEAAGINLVRPDDADRAWVHEIYFTELVRGQFRAEVHDRLVAIIEQLRERSEIDGVILAGTELPLILRERSYAGVPVIDAIDVHVEAAVSWLLGEASAGDA